MMALRRSTWRIIKHLLSLDHWQSIMKWWSLIFIIQVPKVRELYWLFLKRAWIRSTLPWKMANSPISLFFFLKFLQSLVLNRMASYRLSLILLKRVMFRVDQNILHILNIMHQSEQYLFFQSILLYISKNKSLISMTK